jgi:hypothetical protein
MSIDAAAAIGMVKPNCSESMNLPAEVLIDRAVMALRKALADEAVQAIKVLVDPALSDPVRPLCETYRLPTQRIAMRFSDLPAGIAPYLVTVEDEEAQERFVNATIRIAIEESIAARDEWPASRSVCAWIILNDAQMNRFTNYFATRAVIRPQISPLSQKLLRFWDPRVFPHLARIAGSNLWRHWLNTNATWLYIDGWGHVVKHSFAEPVVPDNKPCSFSADTWHALERVGEINQSLVMSGSLNQVPNENALTYFDRLLLQAAQLGCRRPVDRVTYAVLVDLMRFPIEQHRDIGALLTRTREEDIPFSGLVANFEPADWDRIREDLAGGATSDIPSISNRA